MMLIDTSAWIEFLRPRGDAQVKRRVADCLESATAAYTCPVRFELLAGAKDNELDDLNEALSLSQRFAFDEDDWEQSAKLEQRLRKAGAAVSRDDIFVATVALRRNLPLLCKDIHFDMIRDRGRVNLVVHQLA